MNHKFRLIKKLYLGYLLVRLIGYYLENFYTFNERRSLGVRLATGSLLVTILNSLVAFPVFFSYF